MYLAWNQLSKPNNLWILFLLPEPLYIDNQLWYKQQKPQKMIFNTR